jgi:phage-related protein
MPSELSRKDVCKLYDNYFYRMMNGASPNHAKFKAEVLRLKELYKKHGKLRLFCWCAPKQCHVKTIKTWLEESL